MLETSHQASFLYVLYHIYSLNHQLVPPKCTSDSADVFVANFSFLPSTHCITASRCLKLKSTYLNIIFKVLQSHHDRISSLSLTLWSSNHEEFLSIYGICDNICLWTSLSLQWIFSPLFSLPDLFQLWV